MRHHRREKTAQSKYPVAFGYIAGALDRWSRDLHHAEMSDVVDAENNRPKGKVSVTEKIRANVCDPDAVTLEEQVKMVCALSQPFRQNVAAAPTCWCNWPCNRNGPANNRTRARAAAPSNPF
ncbi:hypothetical protein JNB71_22580 [Rhizobium herbae]|uniref:Uncharacterized protein n=1 Tax=Rhizobium herbae TaxID=508661 RepID=A0ABS7HFY2_9HYPH|nr:hypothetical protein [Rhizobium herbae]MBW9066098.1 hypothetical protein [Rhizobium herbae]